MAFLQASAFGKTNFFGDRYRARPADLHLYSGVPSIYNMATPLAGPRMTRLVDALIEHKAKLLPAQVCHYLWNFFYSCPLFTGRSRTFPRGCVQRAYDSLWSDPADRDTSEDAEIARSKNYPQLVSENSLAFLSYCFVTFAICKSQCTKLQVKVTCYGLTFSDVVIINQQLCNLPLVLVQRRKIFRL